MINPVFLLKKIISLCGFSIINGYNKCSFTINFSASNFFSPSTNILHSGKHIIENHKIYLLFVGTKPATSVLELKQNSNKGSHKQTLEPLIRYKPTYDEKFFYYLLSVGNSFQLLALELLRVRSTSKPNLVIFFTVELTLTRTYSPICRLTSSSCGELQFLAKANFALWGKKSFWHCVSIA